MINENNSLQEFAKEECEAMDYKMEHQEEEVKCPRCGRKLIFYGYSSGCEVKCETEGCIHETLRGI